MSPLSGIGYLVSITRWAATLVGANKVDECQVIKLKGSLENDDERYSSTQQNLTPASWRRAQIYNDTSLSFNKRIRMVKRRRRRRSNRT